MHNRFFQIKDKSGAFSKGKSAGLSKSNETF